MSQSNSNLEAAAEKIANKADADVDVNTILDELLDLAVEFQVPEDEAILTVKENYDVEFYDSEEVSLADIEQGEEWVSLEAKVIELWDTSESDSIGQAGLIGDETGVMKFASWAKSDVATVEAGESYRFENIVTEEYEGNLSVKANATSDIQELSEEIEVADDSVTISGVVADLQTGSGLVKRCPEDDCTRVLRDSRCQEHGDVEGEFDLRLKAIIDDGVVPHQVIFGREATEDLIGMSLEEAKQEAMDALDTSVVADVARNEVLGRFMVVDGGDAGNYIISEEHGAKRSDERRQAQAVSKAKDLMAAVEN